MSHESKQANQVWSVIMKGILAEQAVASPLNKLLASIPTCVHVNLLASSLSRSKAGGVEAYESR